MTVQGTQGDLVIVQGDLVIVQGDLLIVQGDLVIVQGYLLWFPSMMVNKRNIIPVSTQTILIGRVHNSVNNTQHNSVNNTQHNTQQCKQHTQTHTCNTYNTTHFGRTQIQQQQ